MADDKTDNSTDTDGNDRRWPASALLRDGTYRGAVQPGGLSRGAVQAPNEYSEKEKREIRDAFEPAYDPLSDGELKIGVESSTDKKTVRAHRARIQLTAIDSLTSALATVTTLDTNSLIAFVDDTEIPDLAALRDKAVPPSHFGLDAPSGYSDDSFADVVSSYAGSALLEHERRLARQEKDEDRAESRTKSIWRFVGTIAAILLTWALTYFSK